MFFVDRADRDTSRFRRVFGLTRITGALALVIACSLAGIAPAQADTAESLVSGNQNASAASAPASALASPVDVVIAVDESASITPAEMTLEQRSAQLLALGEFSPTSKVGVLGFGGPNEFYNATTNPQPAVDPVCPMTEVDSPSRDAAGRLTTSQHRHRRNGATPWPTCKIPLTRPSFVRLSVKSGRFVCSGQVAAGGGCDRGRRRHQGVRVKTDLALGKAARTVASIGLHANQDWNDLISAGIPSRCRSPRRTASAKGMWPNQTR